MNYIQNRAQDIANYFTPLKTKLHIVIIAAVVLLAMGPPSQGQATWNEDDQADLYEPNDTSQQATTIQLNGAVQTHNFHAANDLDWVTFTAPIDGTYHINAYPPESSSANLKAEYYKCCGADGSLIPQAISSVTTPVSSIETRVTTDLVTGERYYIKLENSDSSLFGPDYTYLLSVQSPPTNGAVIIVAGRGRSEDSIQENIHNAAYNLYSLFLDKGETADNIYFLATDPSLEGYDAPATAEDLEYAITQWAAERVGANQALTIYLSSRGTEEGLYLDKVSEQTLTPAQLDQWLTILETTVPNLKSNIIIDANNSGSFIKFEGQTISKKNRVVLTSADDTGDAFTSRNSILFTDNLSIKLEQGVNLADSFEIATEIIDLLHPSQNPWIDADGDAQPNEPEDRALATTRGFHLPGTFGGGGTMQKTAGSWTHFIYASGDNGLYPFLDAADGMVKDLQQMQDQIAPGIQFVVLLDGPELGDSMYYTLDATGLWSAVQPEQAEVRMDNSETLSDFLEWGFARYGESEHYALSLLGLGTAIRGIGPDDSSDTTNLAFLEPNDIREALLLAQSKGLHLNIIDFDVSSFGLFESTSIVAGVDQHLADYVIASPNLTHRLFPYELYREFAGLSPTPQTYAQTMATYDTNVLASIGYPYTVSIFDMARYGAVQAEVSTFGNMLANYVSADPENRAIELQAKRAQVQIYDTGDNTIDVIKDSYVDLAGFADMMTDFSDSQIAMAAQALSSALENFIFYEQHESGTFIVPEGESYEQDLSKAQGIGIFYPASVAEGGEGLEHYIEHSLYPNLTQEWGWTTFLSNSLPLTSPTNTPIDTPIPTNTPQISPTAALTLTHTPIPTHIPTDTPQQTPQQTPTATVVLTNTPMFTPTPAVTSTIPSTLTSTPTSTSMPTATLVLTNTPTLTPAPTITPTVIFTTPSTSTPTPTFTFTATPIPTLTPISTPTFTPTFTPISAPLPTSTPTATVILPNTPTLTPAPTLTSAAVFTPIQIPTTTVVLTHTPTVTQTPLITAITTSMPAQTPAAASTIVSTPIPTPTPTLTPTAIVPPASLIGNGDSQRLTPTPVANSVRGDSSGYVVYLPAVKR